jgi:hypothetical protein
VVNTLRVAGSNSCWRRRSGAHRATNGGGGYGPPFRRRSGGSGGENEGCCPPPFQQSGTVAPPPVTPVLCQADDARKKAATAAEAAMVEGESGGQVTADEDGVPPKTAVPVARGGPDSGGLGEPSGGEGGSGAVKGAEGGPEDEGEDGYTGPSELAPPKTARGAGRGGEIAPDLDDDDEEGLDWYDEMVTMLTPRGSDLSPNGSPRERGQSQEGVGEGFLSGVFGSIGKGLQKASPPLTVFGERVAPPGAVLFLCASRGGRGRRGRGVGRTPAAC